MRVPPPGAQPPPDALAMSGRLQLGTSPMPMPVTVPAGRNDVVPLVSATLRTGQQMLGGTHQGAVGSHRHFAIPAEAPLLVGSRQA